MLIEVLVSVLLFSIGVLGLITIQAQSVKVSVESRMRTEAVFAANEILGRMWVDRSNLASYVGTTTLSALPSGQAVVAVNGSVATITVTWRPPGSSASRQYVTAATLVGN